MTEEWRAIEGYEGYYEVSDRGRVRSLDRVVVDKLGRSVSYRGIVLSPKLDVYGYLHVGLSCESKQKMCRVHRLVAKSFLPASDMPEVNHIDFDKTNNNAENLEWATPRSNTDHAIAGGLYDAMLTSGRRKKLTPEAVAGIHEARRAGMTYAAIGKMYGVCFQAVHNVIKGKQWGGFDDGRLSESRSVDRSVKLKDEYVSEIRALHKSGFVQREIAKKFGVSPATVCLIVNGKRRGSITNPDYQESEP